MFNGCTSITLKFTMNLEAGMNLNALVNGFPDNYSTLLSFPPPNTDFFYVRNHSGDSLDFSLDFFSDGNIATSGYVKNLEIIGNGCILDTCFITVIDTITVTVYDTLLTTVTDTLVINATITGINPPNNQNTLKVIPNPTSTHITIDYGNFNAMNGYTLNIVNSIGQTVFTTPINQQTSYIDLFTWTGNGIYFVQLIDPQNNTIENRKIVLQ